MCVALPSLLHPRSELTPLCPADHPAYARVDYDDLASASAPGGVDDMEDGEIPDHLPPQHLHQHPHPHPHAYQHQANTGRQPASVFGVKAP